MDRRPPASLGYGLVAAALWAVCHLLIHLPRGWPFQVRGEWEILLVALSAAAGDFPPLPAGAIHGVEPGAYLVALLAAPLIALGVTPVLAGKLVALGFGSALAGLCAGWTHTLVVVRHGPGPARWAALLVAVVFACAWPGMHFDLAGMSGRTPESLFFQLLALRLLLSGCSSGSKAAPLICGASLAVAYLFSPLALWTVLIVATLLALPASVGVGFASGRLRFIAWLLLGAVLPFLALGLVLPEGWAGLRLFFAETLGPDALAVSTGLVREHGAGSGVMRPGPLHLLGKVSRALEGGAHNEHLALRAGSLALLAWSAQLAVLWTLWKARSREQRQLRLLAAVSLSWLLPLSLLPLDRGFYPLAYRYWSIPLALGLMLMAGLAVTSLASSGPGWRKWGLLVPLFCVALLPLPSLSRSIIAPAPTLAEVGVGTGAHAMAPRSGYERHYAFSHLRRHAPEELDRSICEGYGLALGADAAVSTTRGDVPQPQWRRLREELPSESWRALLLGVGCGAAAFPSEQVQLTEVLLSGSAAEDRDVGRGFLLCAEGRGRGMIVPVEIRQLLAAELPGSEAIDFSVPEPWALLPDRF